MKRAYISDECEHGYPHPHMKVDGEGCGGGEGSKLLEGPVFVMGKGDAWLVIPGRRQNIVFAPSRLGVVGP